MTKNPIEGLAFVVTSQQEMLEAKQKELDEKQKEINRLTDLTVKLSMEQTEQKKEFAESYARLNEENQQKLEEARHDIEGLQDALKKTRQQVKTCQEKLQKAQDQSDYCSGEYNRVNCELEDIKVQQEEFNKRYGWHKWTPEAEYDLDRYGTVPMVEGMYRYAEDSKDTFYEGVHNRDLPMAGKYSINGVTTPYDSELQQRGKFRVSPSDFTVKGGATLVAVRIHYVDEFILLDDFKIPEE